jgi:thiol-disulfide isomerase/thioredoxin
MAMHLKFFRFPQGVLAAGLFAVASFFPVSRGIAGETQEISGSAAPQWTLKDLNGNPVNSTDFAGKVIVVDFWATWCGPCVEEVPGYVALQKKYGPDGLVVVGISLDRGGPARVRRFVENHGINYSIVMGDDATVESFGGFEGIPTTFLISRDGRIVHRKSGAWPHEDYERLVRKFL